MTSGKHFYLLTFPFSVSSRCLKMLTYFINVHIFFFLPQGARRANWIKFDTTHNISRGRLTALILSVFSCNLHAHYNILLNSRHSRSFAQKMTILFYCFSRFTIHTCKIPTYRYITRACTARNSSIYTYTLIRLIGCDSPRYLSPHKIYEDSPSVTEHFNNRRSSSGR